MVVLMAGAAEVTTILPGLPTTIAGIVSGVVVVVVVVTERTGAGGGESETTCDSGSVAQPARRPSALLVTRMVVIRATARHGARPGRNAIFFIFIFSEYG
jgi:hypothetical protein